MSRATRAVIALSALRHNLQRAREAAPHSRIMAVVKANGYGHGLVRAAEALSGADAYGVSSLDEAAELRDAGITAPIVLLEGFTRASDLSAVREYGVQCVLHHRSQLALLEADRGEAPIAVWLKLDTGMHRLGFSVEDFPAILGRVLDCASVAKPLRLITHLAQADDPDSAETPRQIDLLHGAAADLDAELSIANSAGVLAWPQSHVDWVRPGVMLYGVAPFVAGTGPEHALRPAMTLSSELIAVNRYRRGDRIGYAGTWRCPEDMHVGVVAIGYGDGYPRHAPSGTPVLLNGRRVPLIGRVSMDMLSVDLRSQPQARVGDPVVLWGEGLPVEEVARMAGTIGYELLCGVAPRVKVEVRA